MYIHNRPLTVTRSSNKKNRIKKAEVSGLTSSSFFPLLLQDISCPLLPPPDIYSYTNFPTIEGSKSLAYTVGICFKFLSPFPRITSIHVLCTDCHIFWSCCYDRQIVGQKFERVPTWTWPRLNWTACLHPAMGTVSSINIILQDVIMSIGLERLHQCVCPCSC